MKNHNEKEKRTLAVYIFIFLLLVAGITAGGYVSYRNFEQEFRRQAEKQISAIAELKVDELVNWRTERLSDAGFLYHNPAFSALVERYFENPDDIEAQAQLLSRLEYYQVYNQYDKLYLLDATGIERLSISIATPDLSDSHLAQDAIDCLRSGGVTFLDFHHEASAGSEEIHLHILVPIFADEYNNNPLGVLVLSINPETYLYPYIQNWPIPSDTAETLLVRRDGEDVLFLNELRFEKNAALNLRYPLTNTDIPAVKAVLGQVGIVEGTDYRGEQVLADVRAVPDSPWFLVSKIDTAEVYTPLRARLWQTLLIISMAIFVAGTGLALVWRQQRIAYYRAKAETTEALRVSEEKFRKAFLLSPDSININRLQDGVYVTINDSFTKTTGYTAGEAIGKTSAELNIWVDPQDRERLVEGLEKNGEVANLEMRFRMKNGDIRQGLMSAAVLELDGAPHIISIARDITEHRQAEERLEQFFSVNLDLLCIADLDGNFIKVNKAWESILGYPTTKLEHRKFLEFVHPEDMDSTLQAMATLGKQEQVLNFVNRYRCMDGSYRFIEWRSLPSGNLIYAAAHDITERRQAEEELRRQTTLFRNLFEGSPEAIAIVDPEDRVLNVNRSFETLFGYLEVEAQGHYVNDLLVTEPYLEEARGINQISLERHQVVERETVRHTKDGRLVNVSLIGYPVSLQQRPIGGFAIYRDITERKQADAALRESQSLYHSLVEVSPLSICRKDLTGRFTFANRRFLELSQITLSDLVGKTDFDLHPPELAEKYRRDDQTVMDSGQVQELIEDRIVLGGESVVTQTIKAPIFDGDGNINGVQISFWDITQRRRAENALRESEEKMRSIFRVAPTGIGVVRDRVLVEVNPRISEITGYTKEELIGQSARIFYPTQDEFEWVGREKYNQIAEKGSGVVETRWQKKDGSIIDVLLASTPINLADLSKGVTFTALDITERKRAEEALKESEAIFSSFLEHSPVYVFFKDKENRSLMLSKNYEQMLGMPISSLLGKTMDDLFPSDLAKRMAADDLRILNEGRRITVEEEFNGHIYETTKFPVLKDGKPYILAGFTLDITERKQAEGALRESEARFRALFEQAAVGVAQLDTSTGRFIRINHKYCDILGFTQREMLDLNFHTITHPDDLVIDLANMQRLIVGDIREFSMEKRYYRKDGGIVWVSLTVSPLWAVGELPNNHIAVVQDITERKRTEEALRESEERLRLAVSAGRMGTWDRNFLSGQLDWSAECKTMFGLSPDVEMTDERFKHALHPEDRMPTDLAIRKALEKQADFDTEYRVIWSDGTIHWIAAQGRGYYNEAGQAIHMAGVTFDITERKRAEEALLESEERFRTLYDNATIGLYRTTPDGRILMLNPAGVQMLGFDSFDEIAKRNLEDAEFEASRREFRENIEREGIVIGLESKWARKDGSTIFVRESAKAFRDENGKILYYDGSFEDVTGWVQAEAALRESEELYRKMNENSPLGMHFYRLSRNGRLIFAGANPAANKLLGVDHSQFIEKTIEEAFPPLAQTEVPQRYREAAANGTPWSTEQIDYDDRQIRGAFEVKAFQTTPGNMVAVFADITARKRAEEALRESEALYRQAIEVADAVPYRQSYHVNGNSVDYDFIGEGIRQITGYGPEEFDEPLWDSLTKERFLLEDLAKYSFDEAIERVRSGIDPVWKCEHRIRARDGSIRWVFEAAVELRDQNGISHGSIGLFQDITERKQAEEEIRQLNLLLEQRIVERTAQLETTNKELEAFSYSVSHDLRAPLRGIDGWSQALLEDYYEKLDEQGRLYIDRVRSETQRMGHLIDDMLQLSRLNRAELVKKQVDLSALAQTIVERLKQDEPQRKVIFNIQTGVTAEGDSHLLEVVLSNLLGNAFKFTVKRSNARIEFGQTEFQGQRTFFVRDNGAGFDMVYSQKLFGAFQRMHKVSEFPGTGIGLATVQRVIHRHGGRVWAEAEVERGATFYFTLG